MKLQTIIYTTDMDATVEWYGELLGTESVYRSEVWTSFEVGGAVLAVHRVDEVPAGGPVILSLVAGDTLEAIVDRLDRSGITPVRPIDDEPFGRSVVFADPDGSPIQVNEHG